MVRKYITEFAINMLSGPGVLLQQSDIDDLAPFFGNNVPDFHIYMICSRPRFTFDPKHFIVTEESISGRFCIQKSHRQEQHEYTVPNNLGTTDIVLHCPYPHNYCELRTTSGNLLSGGKAAVLAGNFSTKYWNLLDLEVLYVGQAFGSNGQRLATDRLTSHSTLQKIYADAQQKSPDKEIWLALWAFQPLLITEFDGMSRDIEASSKEEDKHIEKVTSGHITEQHEINFTEAALIKYFQPKYNTNFKDSFPHPSHTSYRDCYDFDLNMVAVELQTEKIRARLWSDAIEPRWIHIVKFPLHSRAERKSMFDFLQETENAC